MKNYKLKSKIVRFRDKRNQKPRKKLVVKNDTIFYTLNPEFEFFGELKNLILKSSPAEKGKMIKGISGLGRVKLAIASGIFMGNDSDSADNLEVDLFIVGDDIDKRKLMIFLKSLEAEVGRELKFGLMEKDEFEYRHGMFDRFIRVLLDCPHEKLINKLGL